MMLLTVDERRSIIMRVDGRGNSQLRPVRITRNYIKHAEGSVLIEMGDTKVICTASLDEKVPPLKRVRGRLGHSGICNASKSYR